MSRKVQKAVEVVDATYAKSPELKAKQRRLLEILKRDHLEWGEKSKPGLNGSDPIRIPTQRVGWKMSHASQDIATLAQDPADARKAERPLH